jgi:hypothetical protein
VVTSFSLLFRSPSDHASFRIKEKKKPYNHTAIVKFFLQILKLKDENFLLVISAFTVI